MPNLISKFPIKGVTVGPKHHFFGFHDLCPWDASGRFLLAEEVDFIYRPPTASDTARICLIDMLAPSKTKGFDSGSNVNGQMSLVALAETNAWNFHQGSRLQWLPGGVASDVPNIDGSGLDIRNPNIVRKCIYNDRQGERFVSVILDVETGEKKVLPAPIYAVSPNGKFALGLNFARLKKYGGYGYAYQTLNSKSETLNLEEPFPKDDGIFRIDLETGEVKLAISIHDVAHLNNFPRENEHHYLTHVNFNPSGTRICFVDKFLLPDGGSMQRFVTANPDGGDIYVLPGHISHFGWRNDAEILAYGKWSPQAVALRRIGILNNPLFKPLLRLVRLLRGSLKQKIAGQSYFLLHDKSEKVRRIAVGLMTEDGHPQFSYDGNWVITDTYPDKNHYRALILYNWITGKKIEIGKFHSLPSGLKTNTLPDGRVEPWDISEMRSDLHPRWNRDGTQICFDSVHDGSRQMYVVDVKSYINKL
ncbi:MAG: hypothetical protein HYT12_01965 [Candidatus Liptonbacteria bacterium]|nr:hypothetical protein [Candidatus Liptonbacteria bacterium]